MTEKEDLETDCCLEPSQLGFRSLDSGYYSKSFSVEESISSTQNKLVTTSTTTSLVNSDVETKVHESYKTEQIITKGITDIDLHSKDSEKRISKGSKPGFQKFWIDPNVRAMFDGDEDGDNQLHLSIIQTLIPISIYIISQAPHPYWLGLPNKLLQTPLHLAVLTRSVTIVQKLLDYKVDCEARDHHGNTALHIACKNGMDDIVAMLVPYYRDLNVKNYNGQACVHLAAENTFLPVLRILISNGADINIRDSKCGRSVLHYAAESGNTILLEYVIQTPTINVDVKTYAGLTPLMLARGKRFTDIVAILKRYGANQETAPPVYDMSDTDSDP